MKKIWGVIISFLCISSLCIAAAFAEVKVGYGWSVNKDEAIAVQEAVNMMKKTVEKPNLVVILAEASYEKDEVLLKELSRLTNGAKSWGMEETYAVFTPEGVHVGEKGSLAILGIQAPSWKIGLGIIEGIPANDEAGIRAGVRKAVETAVADAGKKLTDRPSLIMLAPEKYKEDYALDEIESIFGVGVRVIGGTPGSPKVYAGEKVINKGTSLAIIYADTKVGAAFHSGIMLDDKVHGKVTALGTDPWVLKEIDGKPAFSVYKEWTGNTFKDLKPEESPAIWEKASALPIIRVYKNPDGQQLKVSVPVKVNPDQSMVMGANIKLGDIIYLGRGSKDAYAKRAGTIVRFALVDGAIKVTDLVGGLHIYCRGAAFSQFGKDAAKLQVLVDETNSFMKGKPYIGGFTSGEQGTVQGVGCMHGNLTSSMAVFGNN